MIDPLGAAGGALATQSPAAYGLVFLTGLATSIGPCVAPRYVAIAALAGSGRRAWLPAAAFVGGIIGALMTIGFAAGLLGTLWSISSTMYALLGLTLVGCGGFMLVRAVPVPLGGATCGCPTVVHANTAHSTANTSLGAIVLLGAASTFVISPCCTPVVASIAATSTAIGKPGAGALLLLTYALGHTLPLMFAAHLRPVGTRVLGHAFPAQASAIVAAVLMLALGAYYAVLA
jgi:cytochrome c biogenesis protein CcdA